jgi:hypothetical protein
MRRVWWLALCVPAVAGAQGYRLRLDARVQTAAYRGVTLDSILASDTVSGSNGGPQTPDGYAVSCSGGSYCMFFRPGPRQSGGPMVTTADLSLWGLGVRGLSVRVTARAGADLGSSDAWPGTTPAVQLLEGYAEYATERYTAQLGRQTVVTRFGVTGVDGARLVVRAGPRGLELSGYAGWGLARASALPVTSPALNPLDDFQPRQRQIVAGLTAGWTGARADVRATYQREVDPRSDYFVSERFGVDAAIHPIAGWSLTAGADYDLAAGWWGSAEAALGYAAPDGRVSASLGTRQYRPHFDLWTIWGAFSPVPYHAVQGSVAVTPLRGLALRVQGERYQYSSADVSTPLVQGTQTSGWRFAFGATYQPATEWGVDYGYHAEFGPGASSRGFDGAVRFAPDARWDLAVQAATLDRPLEFRYNEATVTLLGLAAAYRPTERATVSLDATRFFQNQKRPDAGAFDWRQTRVSARVTLAFGKGADLRGVPPAVFQIPEQRGAP